jgi:hypothetical protein
MLTSPASSNIAIRPAQASKLVIHTQASAMAIAGHSFATQPVIDDEDQYGNLETGDNRTQVTASLRIGAGPLEGATTVTMVGGIAAFTNLADRKAEIIALVFRGGALAKAQSDSITVSASSSHGQIVVGSARVERSAVVVGGVHPRGVTGDDTRGRKDHHVKYRAVKMNEPRLMAVALVWRE